MQAPIQYTKLVYIPSIIIWPTKLKGIVKLSPTVTTRGDVNSIANAQQKSLKTELTELTKIISNTRFVGGNANRSMFVKCNSTKPGHIMRMLNAPTNPKKRGILTRDSSPIRFFNTTAYNP